MIYTFPTISKKHMPTLTEIIIIRYNAPEVEDRCIEKVKKHTKTNYILTVVDNYLKNENLGKLWNKLVKKSRCKYVCLLNSDTEVEDGWLGKMEQVLEEDPLTAVVGCSTNACATEQNQGRGEGIVQIDSVAGFCYMMRKEHWERVGGFPENFGFYGQESAMSNKFKNVGLRLKWHKEVFVKHLHSYSAKKEDGKKFNYDKEREDGRKNLAKAMETIVKMKPKIVGMMIVRNEEQNIVNCLEKFLNFAEKIYIVDQYSEDKTPQILQTYKKYVEYKQSDEIEGVRRNLALKMAHKHNPDWVVWLDADEEFEKKAEEELIEHSKDREAISWGFREYTFWDSQDKIRTDSYYGRPMRTWSKRMFRADKKLHWNEMSVHPGDLKGFSLEGRHKKSDLIIKHWGYMDKHERARKYYHYLRLDGHNQDYKHLIQEKGIRLETWQE
jgi:hypothetical protein